MLDAFKDKNYEGKPCWGLCNFEPMLWLVYVILSITFVGIKNQAILLILTLGKIATDNPAEYCILQE